MQWFIDEAHQQVLILTTYNINKCASKFACLLHFHALTIQPIIIKICIYPRNTEKDLG